MSSNRFALLADSDASDSEAPVKKPVPAPQTKVTPPTPVKNDRKPRGEYPQRGAPKKVFIEDRPARDATESEEVRDDRAGGRGRGRGRGTGRGRGRGGPRGDRPDRHSQTGVTDSNKKEHQGWGGDEGKREMEDEDRGLDDAKAEAPDTPAKADEGWGSPDAAGDAKAADGGWGEGAAPESSPAPKAEPEVDPDANLKTLDEYLAERAAAAAALSNLTLNSRQANEGADESQWKDGIKLLREDQQDAFYVGKGDNKPRQRKAKEGKTYIEFEAHFERPGRGGERGRGRGRGDGRGRGEGRGRGGRGRGEGRGEGRRGWNTQQTLDVADAQAFPSLS